MKSNFLLSKGGSHTGLPLADPPGGDLSKLAGYTLAIKPLYCIKVVVVISGSSDEVTDLNYQYKFGNSLLLWDSEIQKTYQVKATPFFYAIDPSGVIVGSGVANSLEGLAGLVAGDIE